MGVIRKWLNSQPAVFAPEKVPAFSLEEVRKLSLAAVEDCTTLHCNRLRTSLSHARDARQLFVLRGEIYQAIARAHCQGEAARRVNELLPAFEGWLPERELTRV